MVFTILKQFIANKWAVALGVGFFLLHPIQVEAVAFISEFRGLLATLFALLALYHYLKQQTYLSLNNQASNKQTHLSAKKQSKPSSQNQAITFYLPWVLFTLAVLSKPSAVVLVPFVFLINHFHFGLKLSKNSIQTLPYALIALIAVLIAHLVQSNYDANFSQYAIAFWQKPFAWLDSIVFYLYKIIYPYHLSASYTLSPKFISTQWWFYPLALLPIALGYLLWLKRHTQPLILFAALLFVTGFFTTSGFVDFAFQKYSLVADRYVYLAMVGVALLIAVVASWNGFTIVAQDSKASKIDKHVKHNQLHWQSGVLLIVLLGFAGLSAFRQVPVWQNPLTLWSHGVGYEVEPKYAHISLGLYFNNTGTSVDWAEKPKQAMVYFNKAINLYPESAFKELSEATYNRGLSFFQQKKYQQALDNFNQAIKIDVNNMKAHNAKKHVLTLLKQCQKAKEAIDFAKQNKVKLRVAMLDNLQKECFD